MVKTTSEIVSIFDEIYMGAERELIQRRKEVELLTRRLKEREQSVAQNVYDNLPSLKLEPREEFLEGVLSHGIPERTEVGTSQALLSSSKVFPGVSRMSLGMFLI